QLNEFLGPVVAGDLRVLLARAQVLADGEHVDVVSAHVAKHVAQLVLSLAESDHKARLRHHLRREALHVLQQRKAVRVHGLRPDTRVKAGHRRGVVVEDVGPRLDHGLHRGEVALEVRGQHLDRGRRTAPSDRLDRAGEHARAAVGEVVAIHRRDDRMTESELRDRFGDSKRLADIELGRPSRRHRAEPAGARADVAQDHERRRPPAPAVEDVRALRLFANGVELPRLDQLLELLEVLALDDARADPGRDRTGHELRGRAHSRMLAGVHSSWPSRLMLRNWPAIMPSMMRWSKLRHMFIMSRTAMPSPMTTGLLTMASVVRMAACG